MHNSQFFSIVVLALLAVFIAFRLYSVLGRRTGHERSHDDEMRMPGAARPNAPAPLSQDAALAMPDRSASPAAPSAGPVARALSEIKLADRGFDAEHFLHGARAAYEMIVTAFAHGERETLRPLLSADVFATFDSEIKSREGKKERVEFTFLALKAAQIDKAELNGTVAEITVAFDSEIMLAGYDPSGALIEGDAKTPHSVTEHWTFSRDTRARDPNWLLVATASGS